MNMVKLISICVALLAVLLCLLIYILLARKRYDRGMERIGILNIVIGIAMLFVIFSPSHQASSLFAEFSIGFIGIFIIAQAIYLLSPFSPLKKPLLLSTPVQSRKQVDDEIEQMDKKIRDALLNDDNIRMMQILDMSYFLDITDLYVPVRVLLEETPQEDEIDIPGVAADQSVQEDPEILLLQQQERRLERAKYAKDPLELLSSIGDNWRHCVLLGEPGIGKTTFLHYLTLQFAQKKILSLQEVIPIYVELNSFLAHPKRDLFDFIATQYTAYGFSSASMKTFLEKRSKEGNIVFLLDALDETFGGENRKEAEKNYNLVCSAITEVAKKYPDARILVTSRPTIYNLMGELSTANDSFKTLEMMGFFDEELKRKFVVSMFRAYQDRYGSYDSTMTPDALMVIIQQDSHLRELSGTPLLLAMITLAYSRGLNVSTRRAEIYDECVNILLERWDKTRGLFPSWEASGTARFNDFEPEEEYVLLRELAWDFHKAQWKVFKKETVLEKVEEFLNNKRKLSTISSSKQKDLAQKMINEIIIGSSLLRKVGNDAYSFSHQVFQEYFAAQQCVAVPTLRDTLIEHQRDLWWTDVILLYVAYSGDEKLFTSNEEDEEDIFSTNLLLRGRYITAATQDSFLSHTDARKVQNYLLNILRETSYWELQQQIAMTLAEIAKVRGAMEQNEKLFEIVENPSYPVKKRRAVVNALGNWGNRDVLKRFKDILPKDQQALAVDIEILKALASRRDIALSEELIELLNEPISSRIGRRIAWTVGFLGRRYVKSEASLAPFLNDCLSNSSPEDVTVRQQIFVTLQRLEDPQLIAELKLDERLTSPRVSYDEQAQIVNAMQVMVPLLEEEREKEDAIDAIVACLVNLQQDESGYKSLAQTCVLTLGIWLKSPLLREMVIPRIATLQEQQRNNDWLQRRLSILLALFSEQEADLIISSLFSGNTSVDLELIDFLGGLELSLSGEDKRTTQFFHDLITEVFKKNRDNVLRIRLIEILGKLADQDTAKELLSYRLNRKVGDIEDEKAVKESEAVLNAIAIVVQELYEAGKIQAKGTMGDVSRLLQGLIDEDADGYLIVNVAETLGKIMIAPYASVEYELYKRELTPEDAVAIDDAVGALLKSKHREKALTGRYYTIALGLLGDTSVIEELVGFICEPTIIYDSSKDRAELGKINNEMRKKIVNILEQCSRRTTDAVTLEQWKEVVERLEESLKNISAGRLVRQSEVAVLKAIARNVDDIDSEGICKVLVHYLNDDDIKQDVYTALEQISKQKDHRVYEDNGTIEVGSWSNSTAELSAAPR